MLSQKLRIGPLGHFRKANPLFLLGFLFLTATVLVPARWGSPETPPLEVLSSAEKPERELTLLDGSIPAVQRKSVCQLCGIDSAVKTANPLQYRVTISDHSPESATRLPLAPIETKSGGLLFLFPPRMSIK